MFLVKMLLSLLEEISAFFWDIAQRIVAIPYRLFGTTSGSHLGAWRWDR